MGRGWPEAEAEAADSGKGIGDETVHLSIWTIPQQPQMTAENRHGYEQAKQPTWPGSAVRRKATACLRASCSVPLAQCRHLDSKNVTCHSKIHQDKQPCTPLGHMAVFRPMMPLWVQS